MRPDDRTDPERGFATVWAAGAIVALLVVITLAWWLGGAVVARHRATGAADLAALAAAGHAVRGVEQACIQARRVAARMDSTVRDCHLRGWDALVRVEAALPGVLARLGATTARARAGPVDRPP